MGKITATSILGASNRHHPYEQNTASQRQENTVNHDNMIGRTQEPITITITGMQTQSLPPTRDEQSEKLQQILKCPVCQHIPRKSKLKSCERGHIVCIACYTQLITNEQNEKKCPICRGKLEFTNVFAEQTLSVVLENTKLQCRNSYNGCTKKKLASEIIEHEEIYCAHRDIPCPAASQGTCQYISSVKNIVRHLTTAKCAVILDHTDKLIKLKEEFITTIRDFPENAESIFQRPARTTTWKPIIFFSRNLGTLLPYITIRRTLTNRWYLEMRAYGPNKIRDQFETKISIAKCVSKEDAQSMPFMPKFIYQGNISSHGDSVTAIANEGDYLCLNDEQIKPLIRNTELFRLKIEFTRKNNEPKQNETVTDEIVELNDNDHPTQN